MRWALVGLATLAALGCGNGNGRYVVLPQVESDGTAAVVLDTREGRLCYAVLPYREKEQPGLLCGEPRPAPKPPAPDNGGTGARPR